MTPSTARGYHAVETADARDVRATLDGDTTAFAALVDRHAPACLRYAMRMLGTREDAEDVTQDTLVRAHRALHRYDPTMSFRTWIMSILINRCRTALLHRRRRTGRVVADELAVASAPDRAVASDPELRDSIDRALAKLDPAQREAFLLKHVEGLTYDEMAVATGAGISALKMRVQRACDRLQLLLQETRNA